MGKTLRSGYTTGTCAAAAAKAAAMALSGLAVPAAVTVRSPQGKELVLSMSGAEKAEGGGWRCWVIKDAGDDPDITNGVAVYATVRHTGENAVTIIGGEGIGRVTKAGLAVAAGEWAINPGPRLMITTAVREVIPSPHGVEVIIAIPGGAELAGRTLNPALGIAGGLSVIGSTGIVEPMSEEAFKAALVPQLSVAYALGQRAVVLVPGKIGERMAVEKLGLPREAVVQCSNFIGHMLEAATRIGMKEVLLLGHPGKIVKVAAGIFHTHNRMADGRMETLVAHGALAGLSKEQLEQLWCCTTTEEAVLLLRQWGRTDLFGSLASRASQRAERFVFGDLRVGTVMLTLAGEVLGMDDRAREIGQTLGWKL